jgi:hypothetical protein
MEEKNTPSDESVIKLIEKTEREIIESRSGLFLFFEHTINCFNINVAVFCLITKGK